MRNAARIAVLSAFALIAACGGGDGSGPSDPVAASIAINAGNNQQGTVATALALAPSVIVKDQRGNPIEGVVVTFAVQGGGGTLNGAQLQTDANGIAQVGAWILGNLTGANTMTATVTGLTPVTFTATARAGPAAALVFVTPPPAGAVNRVAFTTQPVLQLKDLFGNNATQAGVQVTAAIETGGGTLGGSVTVATSAAGTASFTNLSLAGGFGSRTLRFSAPGLPVLLSGTVELLAGAPTSLTAVSPTTLAGVVGSDIASNLIVHITDIDGNPVQGLTVDFTVTAGGGSIPASAMTDADGQAYVSPWTLGTVAGQLNTVSASHAALTPVVFSATPVAGPAAALLLTTEPGTTSAQNGAALVPQPALQVSDQYGNAVAQVVSVTATIGSGGGALGGVATASTAADGTLAFTGLAITGSAGARTLAFGAAGLTGATSASFMLTAGAATTIAASAGNGQSATVGSAVATPPAALVTDQSGNPVAGVAVTFAVTAGGGSATGTAATTDAAGLAAVGSWTLGTAAGTNTLTATSAGLAGSPVGFTATGTAAAANQLALATPPSATGTNGVALAQQPAVQLRDAFGNPVALAGVLVTAQVSAGGGSVGGGSTATTDAAGLATFSGLVVNGPVGPPQTLQFTATGLTAVTGGPVTLVAGAPTQLLLTTPPSATAASGAALAVQPVLQLADAGGNAVSQAGVNVTASLASGGGSLGGTLVLATNGAGQAAFTNLVLSGTVGPRTLGFAAPGLTGVTSGTITLTAGAAATLAASAGQAQSATVGTAVGTAPSVLVTDQSGNPVAGVSVTFAVASGGGSATGLNATTSASGLATVGSWTLGTTAGANTLTATSAGLAGSPLTFTATGNPAPASSLALTTAPSATATSGVAFAQAPSVTLRDAFGNTVPQAGVTITASVASGSGSLLGTTAVQTGAGGVATFGGLGLQGLAGSYTLAFSATGVTGVSSGGITLSAGAPALLGLSAGDGQSATVGTAVATAPEARVTDAAGNPVSGVAVTFVVGAGGGAVVGGSAITNASGLAAVTSWTLGTAAGGNTLTATSAGLTGSPLTFTATALAGAPASITAQSATSQAGRVGIAAGAIPSVLVRDQFDNPVPNANVTFQVTAGGGSISGGAATTSASGIATLGDWTLGRTIVPNTVTATVGALPAVSFGATVTFEVAGAAAGGVHACAITVDGIPFCWGANNAGSVGDGTSTERLGPVPVSGTQAFSSLSAGADFSCGLTAAGLGFCWGFNGRGELGRGSAGGSSVPVAVAGSHTFTTLTTNRVGGTNHACGITIAGALYCWGDNTQGQLGTGSTSGGANHTPLLSNGGATYTQVSAAPFFTCGVRTGGQAYCWGDNTFGQLGDNSKTDRTTPVPVSGGLSFSKLAASQVHTCGLTTAGTVYCWGLNGLGRLGNDPATLPESLVPAQVPGLAGIVDIVAGENHTCVRTAAGAVSCWGENQAGQLGDGNSGNNVASFTPVATVLPGGVSGFAALTAGVYFTCGTTSSGALYCWGEGSNGRLGLGSIADTPLPLRVIDP